MNGFFLLENEELDYCESCGLYKGAISPKMEYSGEGKKKVLIIAEAPGATEDQHGKQLIGEAGELLRDCLDELGYHLDLDFWKINACNCRPPKNRKPTRKELKCCKPRLTRLIKKLKPNFIWLMGGAAVESFYMDTFSDLSITRWRKRCIPDPTVKAWVIPLYHPSYILRNQDKKLEMVFKNDLKWALSCLRRNKPIFPNYEDNCYVLKEKDAIDFLVDILSQSSKEIVFDYETNGLNPWKISNPEVVTIGVYWRNESKSFLVTESIKTLWKKVLIREDIKKIAHNIKFEDKWSRVVFGTPVKGWIWDTMISQHVLDNRKKVTGLKFQAYVRYGIKDYDSEIKLYIKGLHGGMSKETLQKVMKYNAMDALFTYKLYNDQKNEFKRRKLLKKGNELFLNGSIALADVEENGVPINHEYYKDMTNQLEEEISNLKTKIYSSEEAEKFKKVTGKLLDLNSSVDIKKLLYDILKLPVIKLTENENEAIDKEVLTKLKTPFGNDLINYRKKLKVKNTYLAQFINEACPDNKVHPSFDLNFVTSYRSSSSNPNFQNIPIRDEESMKLVRNGIVPSKGNKILEGDYGSLEVRIMACYTHDPVLIDYLVSGGDMHKEEAKHLFLFTDQEWDNLDAKTAHDVRFYTKNQKVFPYFYGSYYKICCENIWPIVKILKLQPHLAKKGIKTINDFEKWMEEDEKRFWKKFKVFRSWQQDQEEEYLSKGKVDFFTGFSIDGYLRKNQLLNMKVQGTAFHCLLWSLIYLNRELKDYRSKIIGQIHDSLVIDLFPAEQETVIELCNHVMTELLRLEWDWIIVPLVAEFEITEIDQPWAFKNESKL